jgi:NADH:ubiquinone oxidoreductase subunit 3 (subunit A)
MDTKHAQEAVVTIEQTQPEKSGIWTFLKALLMIEVLAVGYEYRKRRKKE